MTPERITEFLAFIAGHSPFWRERLQDKEFEDVPILEKMDLPGIQKENPPFGGLLAIPDREIARIFMSPGPIYDVQGTDGDFWRFSEALSVTGFGPGDIVQNTFSYHLSPAGMMFDSALRKLGAIVIPAGIGNTELQIEVLKDCQVTGYVGTPSFLAVLLERSSQVGYRLGRELNLKKAFFTAEKVAPELKEEWVKQGLRISEGYGTADAGCIAYEDGLNTGLKVASSVYVEICRPETGERVHEGEIGEVVVTVFDKAYPLIRFGTGDLSSWLPGEEGRYLSGILGRVGDGVKVKGMFVHLRQFAPLLEEEAWINYFQCIVDKVGNQDKLTIYLEGEGENSQIASLQARLKERIRVTPELMAVPLNSLNRSESQLMDKRIW